MRSDHLFFKKVVLFASIDLPLRGMEKSKNNFIKSLIIIYKLFFCSKFLTQTCSWNLYSKSRRMEGKYISFVISMLWFYCFLGKAKLWEVRRFLILWVWAVGQVPTSWSSSTWETRRTWCSAWLAHPLRIGLESLWLLLLQPRGNNNYYIVITTFFNT